MDETALYNWGPTAQLMLMGLLVAGGPLVWVWWKSRGASVSRRVRSSIWSASREALPASLSTVSWAVVEALSTAWRAMSPEPCVPDMLPKPAFSCPVVPLTPFMPLIPPLPLVPLVPSDEL